MRVRLLAAATVLVAASSPAPAQPTRGNVMNPDHLGICYLFEKDEMKKIAPCVLSSGNDEHGNFFTVMHNLATDPVRIEDNLGHNAERLITLNGRRAEVFSRDLRGHALTREQSYTATPEEHENFLTCFRTKDSTTSYCFKRSEM